MGVANSCSTLDPDHYYVERKPWNDFQQIDQLFPYHFLPMVPLVFNTCVLGVVMFQVFPYFL
jgi:phosphatidate phosphatase APP1